MIQRSRLKRKKSLKRSPLKQVSKKRAAELKKYAVLRDKFLSDQPWCEIGATNLCARKSQEIHHIRGRNAKRLNDRKWFVAVCRSCHAYAHDQPKWARTHNWIQT